MIQLIQNKIREYRCKFIKESGYVVEVGSFDMDGGARHLFDDANDFCGIDTHRGPGVDIISPFNEVNKLFDFNPDTIIFVQTLPPDKYITKTIRAIRELLIQGGFLIVSIPKITYQPYLDLMFGNYNVLDISDVESTICGIAQKPYTIRHEQKTN